MTSDDLHAAEQWFQRTDRDREQAREHRNQLIRQAVTAGWTHAQVAAAVGFSRARVAQIAPRKHRQGKAHA